MHFATLSALYRRALAGVGAELPVCLQRLTAQEPLSSAPGRLLLPVPVEGRHFRLHPLDWSTRISLKLELFGCSQVTPTPTPTPPPPPRCLEEMGLESGLLHDSLVQVRRPGSAAGQRRPGGQRQVRGGRGQRQVRGGRGVSGRSAAQGRVISSSGGVGHRRLRLSTNPINVRFVSLTFRTFPRWKRKGTKREV